MNEFLRDLEALASPLFYALVMARTLIGIIPFFYLLALAGLFNTTLFFTLRALTIPINRPALLGATLLLLISTYYKSSWFFGFTALVFLALLFGQKTTRKIPAGTLALSTLLGLASAALSLALLP
ncbi:hypothetical protein C4580_01115 [Candidatus Woesearchaeota archaeon]|nr:MAG: hypothetical protein C4580_01115 [Candidatus Woesearchaeota archaeon]